MLKKLHKSTPKPLLYIFIVQCIFVGQVFCQINPSDSIINASLTNVDTTLTDSLGIDSTQLTLNDTVDIKYDDGGINGPITYKAKDSIVYDLSNKKMYLYNGAYMKYTDLELESSEIEFDWTTYTLVSRGERDSTGAVINEAKFTQSSGTYSADSMQYNFKTKKGRTFAVVTEQDGAYIHSEIVQKNEYDEWYGYKTKYTTCTNIEHPHFYLAARRSKVIPNKVMVTGPVNLVVAGINTPLLLPFGIFPTKQGKKSGIVMPKYGEQPGYGFFLTNGGYYWAVNDKLSLTFLGSIYTRGRFALSSRADYNKRYKRNGSFQFSYEHLPPNDKFLPDASSSNQYDIQWRHRMDNKARPNVSFQANIDASSRGYNKAQLDNNEKVQAVQTNSNISFRRTFRGKPYNFTIYAGHNQNMNNKTIKLTLPELGFNVNQFTPFQKKIQSQKKRFYEKIVFQYNAKAKASVSTADSLLFTQDIVDDIQYGIVQEAKIGAPFNLANFFTIRPSFDYTERWYFKREQRYFTGDSIVENGDTVYREYANNIENGFFGVRNLNLSTSISTTVTGIFNFKKRKNVKALRHIIKPNLSYTFSPDYTKPKWGYLDEYYNPDQNKTVTYNKYQSPNDLLYGVASGNMSNRIGLNITNNFELKVRSKKDTVNQIKKIPLLDQLNIGTSYDFTADSLKLAPLSISAVSNIFKGLISWNIRSSFSPYALHDSLARPINESFYSTNKRLLRFEKASVSINFNLRGKSKATTGKSIMNGTVHEREYILNNPQLYYDFNIPWSLSANYNIGLVKGVLGNPDSLSVSTHSVTLNGHLNITPKWQINLRTGYDIKLRDLTLTSVRVERDLHCWVLAFDWTAYPLSRQTYAIELRVKSPILQELKLTRKKPLGASGITNF